jgi:hypothetical protein
MPEPKDATVGEVAELARVVASLEGQIASLRTQADAAARAQAESRARFLDVHDQLAQRDAEIQVLMGALVAERDAAVAERDALKARFDRIRLSAPGRLYRRAKRFLTMAQG